MRSVLQHPGRAASIIAHTSSFPTKVPANLGLTVFVEGVTALS